jgi:WXG100 family type VII secretion target
MAKLRVTPEELRAAAGRLSQYNSSFKGKGQQCNAAVDEMLAQWDGEASNVYQQKYASFRKEFDEAYRAVEAYVNALRRAAAEYEARENANKARANSLRTDC